MAPSSSRWQGHFCFHADVREGSQAASLISVTVASPGASRGRRDRPSPSTAALGGIGRLLLAGRRGDDLIYVGGVGTGFGRADAILLRNLMDRIVIPKPAVMMAGKRKKARWIAPELVAEIAFRAWTNDGKLRHASFKGLRENADEASVFELI